MQDYVQLEQSRDWRSESGGYNNNASYLWPRKSKGSQVNMFFHLNKVGNV